MGLDAALTTRKGIVPVPYNRSLYGTRGNTTFHRSGMISWSWRIHGFGIVPQYASSVGMKMSWNRGEISWGNVAFKLPVVRPPTTNFLSDSSSALRVIPTRHYERSVL